jgi:signal transduction histidine kinase
LEARDDNFLAGRLEVASAAHDLRNRLSIASCEIQELRRQLASRGCDPGIRETLASVQLFLARSNTLLETLLDMTRCEIGVPTSAPPELDIVSLAKQLVAENYSTSRGHAVELVASDPPLIGRWTVSRLRVMLHVLLTNAVQYGPAGGQVVVRIAQEGDDAIVSVSDQGIGIPAADLPRVFDPFFRARNAESHTYGLGLGLSIARLIVEQYAGVLDVQSIEGVGSTFTVRLPLLSP